MSVASFFENLLVQEVCLFIFVFLIVFLFINIMNKIFPGWKEWFKENLKNDDEKYFKELRCSSLLFHNFKDFKNESRCLWCGKSIEELRK